MKLSTLIVVALVLVIHSVQAATPGKDLRITGTYEFIVCKGSCSFANRTNVFATAVVVFFDRVIATPDQERIDPFYNYDPQDVRACYAVNRQVQAHSYLGINNKAGVSPWKRDGDNVQFDLFHSADAGYAVEVSRTGELLIGTGRSWGVGGGAPPSDYSPDTVIGRRKGPPDITACASAASS